MGMCVSVKANVVWVTLHPCHEEKINLSRNAYESNELVDFSYQRMPAQLYVFKYVHCPPAEVEYTL